MTSKLSPYPLVPTILLAVSCLSSGQTSRLESSGLQVLHCDTRVEPPAWALLERKVIDSLNRAGVEFYNTYVEDDGTVTFKERYEGGMNSSDDLYEAFRGFSLHTALGGSDELDKLHRQVWEGITRQFTRYGQIYREFDSNWDWMHHGEGYVSFYPLGMIEPHDPVFRDRAIRFAAMYIGDDPEAPNWDPEKKMMRAVMNGSRGPKMEWVKRDWIPTNANLVYYPLPFQDIPGVDTSSAWINDHPDNDLFAKLVKTMSDRMAKGDVPINLTSTALIASAYLYTGEERYVQWVEDYVGTWEKLTRQNNGITPDNVGLSGKIGEYTGGKWWGGYYGWVWPRGGTDIVLAELTAAKVATLLTGESRWMNLPRSQMTVLREQGKIHAGTTLDPGDVRKNTSSDEMVDTIVDGTPVIPRRHDERGWYDFIPEPAYPYLNLWFVSQNENDWQQIERLAEAQKQTSGKLSDPDLQWAYFVKGRNPDFAERAFRRDLKTIARKVELIQNEHGDSETWVDNKWINMDPMEMENLTRLSVGGIPIHVRGEMLHSQVRYFDGERRRSGLPPDVAAMVSGIERDWIEVEVVNLNLFEPRQLIIQGGAYGEHHFLSVDFKQASAEQPVGRTVKASAFALDLSPGAGSTLKIHLERYSNQPSYEYPWDR
ncbi:MAG: hypothetical protein O3C43_17900 [Verrucomicrobia bacterium]|nr:hypothetical protein [Verrucomicrobiota bacterium]MDA1068365.1 hypothetical protein [Verrucomicrobiota bacterium]